MKKLTLFEQAFVNKYEEFNGNGTKAYLDLNPEVTKGSASTLAWKLLKKPHIQAALQLKQDETSQEQLASKEYLIQEAHEIGLEAREAGKLNTALTAVETKGKLNRVFDREESNKADYTKLLQSIVVVGDVNINTPKEQEENSPIIDIG